MTGAVCLVGPLADARLCAVLSVAGDACTVAGRLIGGARAGAGDGAWPVWHDGPGQIAALRVTPGEALRHYADAMGLQVQMLSGQAVLGVAPGPAGDDAPWTPDTWLAGSATALARLIAEDARLHPAAVLHARLPQLGIWADSRRRGAGMALSGGDLVADRGSAGYDLIARRQPFAGYFAVDEWRLRHATHTGGRSAKVVREGFVMGDAVVVLPWDPVRDRVLVVEQFRLAPAMRHDPQPWLLEPIAGRVDAGETVEQAARREAYEEAALDLRDLIPAVHHYPSPGAVTEYLYTFIGIADLPDGIAGVHGLASEAEDIRGHLIARADLIAMRTAGQISNGPLAMLTLFLQAEGGAIRDRLSVGDI